MQLPPSLAPWREALARFPEELALGIAPMVQRLSAAIGSLSHSYLEGLEPDGFDGVAQRGEYQRLLATEWLLCEEEPDEFLRRAAMSEHLFLKIARNEPRGCKRSIALFDAGPSQLGSPRLAHLAMLIVLEARAHAAAAEFTWGVLQRPEQVRARSDEDGVLHLLRSRSPFEATSSNLDEWLERLAPVGPDDEVWWIGAPRLAQLVGDLTGSRMTVRDPLLASEEVLEVSLEVRKEKRALRLELPAPTVRTQIIRNPFEQPRRRTLPGSTGEGFWFSADGRRLLVLRGQRVDSYMTGFRQLGAPRVYRPDAGHRLVAIGWSKRRFASLTRAHGGWFITVGAERYPTHFIQKKPSPPLGDTPPCKLFVVGVRPLKAAFVDTDGTLFTGKLRNDEGFRFRPVMDQVLDLSWRRGHFDYLRQSYQNRLELGRLTFEFRIVPNATAQSVEPAEFHAAYDETTQVGAYAIRVPVTDSMRQRGLAQNGRVVWQIQDFWQTHTVEVHSDHRVLGVVGAPSHRTNRRNADFRLLVQSGSGRTLVALGALGSDEIQGLDVPISDVELSPISPHIAYRNAQGNLWVGDLWAPFQSKQLVLTGGIDER